MARMALFRRYCAFGTAGGRPIITDAELNLGGGRLFGGGPI